MRIIEPPKTQKKAERLYRIRCRTEDCSVLVELYRSELQIGNDWNGGVYYCFTCPHCQTKVSIASGSITKYIVPEDAEKSSLIEKALELVEKMQRLMQK